MNPRPSLLLSCARSSKVGTAPASTTACLFSAHVLTKARSAFAAAADAFSFRRLSICAK
jgi:hypothetical protein